MNETMEPGRQNPEPAAVELLSQAVQGAHDGIDRLADSATPVARRLGERLSAAEQALHDKTDQWRHTRQAWVEGTRTTVRGHPLLCLAAAAALGAVVARVARRSPARGPT